MNEQLQQAVASLIEKSISALQSGADFLSEQIPDVVHQLLVWHAIKSGIFFVLGVLLVVVWIVADYKLFKLARKADAETRYSMGENTGLLWGALGLIPRAVIFAFSAHLLNLTWLQIWIAPKVWLIEYGMKLVK